MTRGRPKKTTVPVQAEAESIQALLDRIDELEREKNDLAKTQIDANPDDAMAYLMKQNAEMMKALGSVVNNASSAHKPPPAQLKRRANYEPSPPYVLTDERKSEIENIFEEYKDKGIQYSFDKSGSVTFRKRGKIRIYDKDNEVWVREEVWKFNESVHCSSLDATIRKLVKFMVLMS